MFSTRLTRGLISLGLLLTSSLSFATQSTLNIIVENQSQTPYTLVIYGAGSTYEIIDAFDTLASQKSATVKIDYQLKAEETKNHKPVYHVLLLNSDTDCCRVEYTAHPAHPSQYHFFKPNQFKAKLKSYTGPCKVWKESADTLHIILVEKTKKA